MRHSQGAIGLLTISSCQTFQPSSTGKNHHPSLCFSVSCLFIMTHSTMYMIKAHLPVILDYFGLGTPTPEPPLPLAWSLTLFSYVHRFDCLHQQGFCRRSCLSNLCGCVRISCYRALSCSHSSSYPRILWRSPPYRHRFDNLLCNRYETKSLSMLTIDLVHNECGYQVIIGRPRDLHLPTVPPKHPKHSPLPTDAWLQCTDVAGAWWLNLILTYPFGLFQRNLMFRLYVDFVFAISLLQRSSHGRIRLPDTDTEAGSAPA